MDVYEIWIPIKDVSDQLDIVNIQEHKGLLTIILSDVNLSNKQYKLTFKNPLAYRKAEESARLETIGSDTIRPLSFTKSSQFISWIKKESLGIYDNRDLTHYSIIFLDGIIDIISEYAPDFELVF